MEDENEYLKLPVEDRCVHKLWKARVSGYEEAIKLFNQYDGDDSNWKKVRRRINSVNFLLFNVTSRKTWLKNENLRTFSSLTVSDLI